MLKNYFLVAWKVYMRRKLFTAINLLCIILTMVVLLMVTTVLQNAFFPSGVEGRSDRYLQVDTLVQLGKDDNIWMSPLGYKLIDQHFRKMKSVVKVAAITSPQDVSVYMKDRVEKLQIRYTDAAYWEILNFNIVAGRWPNASDVEQGRFVVVLNASTAKKLFGEQTAIAQKINIQNQQFEVIGVVEDAFHFNAYSEMWAPMTTMPSTDYMRKLDGDFTALLMAKTPADTGAIKAEVLEIAKTLKADDPKEWQTIRLFANSKLDMFARGFSNGNPEADSGATTVLIWVAILMLIFMTLPALNLVNLNIGRMLERSSEIGVRKAFGATRMELVLQFLVENVFLCFLGCLLALLCTQLLLMWISYSGIIPYLKVSVDLAIFGYGLVFSLIFGVMSGVLPAWKMARLEPVLALKGNA